MREQQHTLNHVQVGNGIQVPCNAAHAMRSLGLLDKLTAKTTRSATAFLNLNYTNGEILLNRDLSRMEELHGAPWLYVTSPLLH